MSYHTNESVRKNMVKQGSNVMSRVFSFIGAPLYDMNRSGRDQNGKKLSFFCRQVKGQV